MPEPIWHSYFGTRYEPGEEPNFFDHRDLTWMPDCVSIVSRHRTALANFVASRKTDISPYFFQVLQSRKQPWKTYPWIFWGRKHHGHIREHSELVRDLQNIPGLVSAGLSILEAGGEIPEHHGETNTIFRCHFGIDIPEGPEDCFFEVEEERRSWDAPLVFCDARRHRAVNHRSDDRVILILDVIRPEYIGHQMAICRASRATLSHQKWAQRWPMLKGKWFRSILNGIISFKQWMGR